MSSINTAFSLIQLLEGTRFRMSNGSILDTDTNNIYTTSNEVLELLTAIVYAKLYGTLK